jgi:hypothetical protein
VKLIHRPGELARAASRLGEAGINGNQHRLRVLRSRAWHQCNVPELLGRGGGQRGTYLLPSSCCQPDDLTRNCDCNVLLNLYESKRRTRNVSTKPHGISVSSGGHRMGNTMLSRTKGYRIPRTRRTRAPCCRRALRKDPPDRTELSTSVGIFE